MLLKNFMSDNLNIELLLYSFMLGRHTKKFDKKSYFVDKTNTSLDPLY